MMGTPKSLWPVSPIASGTEEDSTNSMYAMPFDLLEFLSEIILTSLTWRQGPAVSRRSHTKMTDLWASF